MTFPKSKPMKEDEQRPCKCGIDTARNWGVKMKDGTYQCQKCYLAEMKAIQMKMVDYEGTKPQEKPVN